MLSSDISTTISTFRYQRLWQLRPKLKLRYFFGHLAYQFEELLASVFLCAMLLQSATLVSCCGNSVCPPVYQSQMQIQIQKN